MATMNVSLPQSLKTFVDEQVDRRGYGTSSEYVRELIRRDRDREGLRRMLMEGGASPVAGVVDDAFFDALHARARDGG